ncbi:low molecular weight phosphatase family protein [Nakamurella flava]|uniref:Low molecular weight phosphatase family protein n=1 Tax=Nakamurella flava TaxID=2576308 RepID=A0A4U6QE55_9ACTN|nr:low molecular weight phosphatase family protein [Nakamurella flava]TKV58272.1 low molecular weight phosphatase family protein [Nakamurella flava]
MTGHLRPRVLFVCARNRGKSPMAAGLLQQLVGDAADVTSAGTAAAQTGDVDVNPQSRDALIEVGADISQHRPRLLTAEMARAADVVVVLGREARLPVVDGPRIEVWETDEPSARGIDGMERMRLVRDDIARRVADLADRLGIAPVAEGPSR